MRAFMLVMHTSAVEVRSKIMSEVKLYCRAQTCREYSSRAQHGTSTGKLLSMRLTVPFLPPCKLSSS